MTHARVLASRLADLLSREHAAMADFLVELADFDRRESWRELGYSSLFYFLHRDLGLSKGAAQYRKTAAELIRKFPEVVEPFRDGRLCITSVVHLAKVLTPENRQQMLPRFFHLSRRDSMMLAAAIQPASAGPHREVVTSAPPASRVELAAISSTGVVTQAETAGAVQPDEPAAVQPGEPAAVQPGEPAAVQSAISTLSAGATGGCVPNTVTAPPPLLPARPDSSEPLTGELSRLHITVSRQFLEKLEAARSALSHTRGGASAASILEAGLDLVLKQYARRRGLTDKPRNKRRAQSESPRTGEKPRPKEEARNRPATKPGVISAAVKREVWIRDKGRCQWPLESGGICGSTWRLQVDHVVPLALGGTSTAGNLRVLCTVHNDLAARRVFGDAWMDRFTGRGARRRTGPAS